MLSNRKDTIITGYLFPDRKVFLPQSYSIIQVQLFAHRTEKQQTCCRFLVLLRKQGQRQQKTEDQQMRSLGPNNLPAVLTYRVGGIVSNCSVAEIKKRQNLLSSKSSTCHEEVWEGGQKQSATHSYSRHLMEASGQLNFWPLCLWTHYWSRHGREENFCAFLGTEPVAQLVIQSQYQLNYFSSSPSSTLYQLLQFATHAIYACNMSFSFVFIVLVN